MARDRDIAAFDARAVGYERDWLGRMHHDIADRTADLALSLVLDVGCGTGYLLRQLARRCPQAVVLAGVDPALALTGAAQAAAPGGGRAGSWSARASARSPGTACTRGIISTAAAAR